MAAEFFLPTNFNSIFIPNVPPITDASYIITLNADIQYLNQVFLFYVDPSLSTANLSDFRFSLNARQWNAAYETNKTQRKYIIENLLLDLFGIPGGLSVLGNLDLFSNEEQLDNDISNIFTSRLKDSQITNLLSGNNGAFDTTNSLVFVPDSIFDDFSTNNPNALTKLLLEQAKDYEDNNPNSGVLSRQFSDISNLSNGRYILPEGWRTFVFRENEILNFNVVVRQPPSSIPQWAANQQALIDGGTPTSYRFRLVCKEHGNITPPLALFKRNEDLSFDELLPGLICTRYEDNIKYSDPGGLTNKTPYGSTYLRYRDNNGIDGSTNWTDLSINFQIANIYDVDVSNIFGYINWEESYIARENGAKGGVPTIVPYPTFGDLSNANPPGDLEIDQYFTIRWDGFINVDLSAIYYFSTFAEDHVHIFFKIGGIWTTGLHVQRGNLNRGPAVRTDPYWTSGARIADYISSASEQLNILEGQFLEAGLTQMLILYGGERGDVFLDLKIAGGNIGIFTQDRLIYYSKGKLNNIDITISSNVDTVSINSGILRNINDMAYSSQLDTIVAVGDRRGENLAMYSLDLGFTWLDPSWVTGQSTQDVLGNANEILNVVWTGTRFIATTTRTNNRQIIFSNDGIIWDEFTFPFSGVPLSNIANNGEDFVVTTLTGGNVALYTNSNGTYTSSNLGITNILMADYLNGNYIVGGLDGVFFSANGTTWQQCQAVFSTNILGQNRDVAYGNGVWFITNDEYDLITTTDAQFPNGWDVIQTDNSFFTSPDTPLKVTYVPTSNSFYVGISSETNNVFIRTTDFGVSFEVVGNFGFNVLTDILYIPGATAYNYIDVSEISNLFFYNTQQRFDILQGYNDASLAPSG